MTLSDYKKAITQILSAHSDTPHIDAELLLMHVLKKTRTQLLIALNDTIDEITLKNTDDLVARRCLGEPIAYLIGHQAFWTMDLCVTHDTLIPRPDTECLIEWVLQHFSATPSLRIVDLGTGSGAIALSLAREKPLWKIDATDQSPQALDVAKRNAATYAIENVSFYRGNWYDALPHTKNAYDLIISNPPYIAENDPHLAQLTFEPTSALVSGKEGLSDIEIIARDAIHYLKNSGTLIVEHGYNQADAVNAIFEKNGFTDIHSHRDLANQFRFTTGQHI